MRVLHVSPSIARADGGPTEALRSLTEALGEDGVHVEILTTDKKLTTSEVRDLDRSKIHLVTSVPSGGFNFARGLPSKLSAIIDKFDVVHIHGWQSYVGSVAMKIARARNVPYLVEPHGALDKYHWRQNSIRKRAYLKLVDRENVKRAAGFVVSSTREADHARAVLGERRIENIPLGIDEDLLLIPRGVEAGPFALSVLFLGRVTEKKRIDLVIDAVRILHDKGCAIQLTVAGPIDPALKYNPREYAAKAGVSDLVDFRGVVDSSAREALMGAANVFVLMSEDESFGVAVAEAMAAGLAVVTSVNVGIAEEAEKNNALIVAPMTPSGLAAALRSLAQNPEDVSNLAGRARSFAASSFTWRNSASRLASFYAQMKEES